MADGFTCDVVGLGSVDQILAGLVDKVVDAGAELLKPDVERNVLEPSQQIVPYLSGDLHDSGYVSDAVVIGDSAAVTVGYGNDEVNYALDQHENPTYEHQEGKSDKFLEKPILEWAKEGPSRIAHGTVGLVKP